MKKVVAKKLFTEKKKNIRFNSKFNEINKINNGIERYELLLNRLKENKSKLSKEINHDYDNLSKFSLFINSNNSPNEKWNELYKKKYNLIYH